MPLLDIRVDHLKIVQDILKKHVPTHEVWAFGSRAKWLAKEYSDLDLCILGETPLSFRTLGLLEEAFEDSDLPYTVDVVDWATTSESFRKIIKRDRVVVQKVGRGLGAEWVDIRLGDACTKIGSGATPKGGGSVYLNEGPIAFVRSQNIHNEGLSKDGMVYLDEKLAQGLANVQVEELDVLLNITGDSVARACQVIKEVLPARVNQHVVIIRANQKILWPTYLRYFLVSSAMQAHMLGLASVGATRNALTKGMIESFTIRCPKEVDYQKAIADVLGSFDDKIAINRRINQTLEAMAQAIFKSWFVNFDPVKAKIAAKISLTPALSRREREEKVLRSAMCAISGKMDAELDTLPPEQYDSLAATAALVPDEMEESELGEIPKGWEVKALGNVTAYLNRGISPKYLESGGVLVLNQKCIRDFRIDSSKGRRHDPGQRKIDDRTLELGDVLVNSTGVGTLGRVAQLLHLSEQIIVDSHVTVVRTGRELSAPYIGQYMVWKQHEIEAMGEGSTGQTELSRIKLTGLRVLTPSKAVLIPFDRAVYTVNSRIAANDLESERLADLRDTLLPKLLSGELSIENISLKSEATA